jgi:hypothetical protein
MMRTGKILLYNSKKYFALSELKIFLGGLTPVGTGGSV